LPNDFEYELGDLDIGFLMDATPGTVMKSQIEDVDIL
jgi:hypothetical protein